MSGDLIQNLNSENFKATIHDGVVLVDFWAPWCGPCQRVLLVLEELYRKVSQDAVVAKVNVDENRELTDEFNVRGIPTMILFKDGVESNRFVGTVSSDVLEKAINEVV